MTSERFKEITARCQPHPVFSSDWTHYYSNDFADSLLPEAGIVKGKHLQFYEVWLHSLGEIHNFRWRMCKTISLLGLFLPILFYLKFRNSDMQDFLLVFLYYSMFPIFNTFIWLFKKNKTKRDVPFLRFIVILTTDFLFFLSCTFPYNHQLKEILLFIPISAATAVIYICWADSTDIVAKMAITTNPENGFKTVVPKLPIEMKSLIKNRQAIPFMDSAFSRYYIFFILLSFIPLIGIWCNGGNLVEHHSASQHALTLIAFGVPIFFMCWGLVHDIFFTPPYLIVSH